MWRHLWFGVNVIATGLFVLADFAFAAAMTGAACGLGLAMVLEYHEGDPRP